MEHIALSAQIRLQGHDDRLAQRIDGRVGDLCKLLAEIVVQRALLQGQHRHGRVVAHGAHGFITRFRQRAQHLIALFKADLEHFHVGRQIGRLNALGHLAVEGIHDALRALFQPALVGMGRLQPPIDLVAVQQLPRVRVHHQQLTRTDAPLGHHVFIAVGVRAHLRGQGDQAVAGAHPARGAQAVAIQQANRVAPVRQHDARRPVPGFHVHGVIFVKRLQVRVDGVDVLPGRRNQHTQRPRHVDTAGEQDIQHIIQAGRIRTAAVDQGRDCRDVGQVIAGKQGGARLRPIAVALDGVDFAVVGQEPKRLRQRPARQGVGGEALVEHADRRAQALVREVVVKARQVHRHDQRLVGDDARRKATDIKVRIVRRGQLGPASGDEQVRGQRVLTALFAVNKQLLNARQGIEGDLTADRGADGHLAPAEHAQAALANRLLQGPLARLGPRPIPTQKDLTDSQAREALSSKMLGGQSAHKGFGHLQQQATAVTGAPVRGNPAAVSHTRQRLDGHLQQAVAGLARHVRNQTKAAVVAKLLRAVQARAHAQVILLSSVGRGGGRAAPLRIAGQQLRDRPGLLAGPERYRPGYRDRLPQLFTATVYRKKASQREYCEQGAAGQGGLRV